MKRNKKTTRSTNNRTTKRHSGTNKIKIIGGDWRSRNITFVDAPNLRPTPSRLRETLFNWLQTHITDAHCLDLFAGTGILGIEALSRGAAHVQFVEKNLHASNQLRSSLGSLSQTNKHFNIKNNDALSFIEHTEDTYDLIFLDPPFKQNFLDDCLQAIQERKRLKPNGLIYIECEKELAIDIITLGYSKLKEKQAGEVFCALLQPLSIN